MNPYTVYGKKKSTSTAKKEEEEEEEEGNVNCETQTRNNVGHFCVKSYAKCFGIKCPYFASAPFQF